MSAVRIAFAAAILALAQPAGAQVCSPDELISDVANCGTCTNDCRTGDPNANWICAAARCEITSCKPGYYDNDGQPGCEYACTFRSPDEACNGQDDDCDGQTDEAPLTTPSAVQVCGTSPVATSAECTSQVSRTCVNGAWQCGFPANVCTGGNCASTAETCDALDNNCNGQLNENTPNFGKACASDDGLPPGMQGQCRTTGNYICSGPNSVMCNAVAASCTTLPGGCTEQCDGLDNDCDGSTDETYLAKGINGAFFVQPAVTRIAANTWITSHEISRVNASGISAGEGNGYVTSAPVATPLDRTRACSVPSRRPWNIVTPTEAQQACTAMGGSLCATTDHQAACQATAACVFGYSPRGAACQSVAIAGTKYCNVGVTFDSNTGSADDDDAILITGSPLLANCWTDWSGLLGNTGAATQVFDMTGNLREITQSSAGVFAVRGGSFLNDSESGGTCTNNTWVTDSSHRTRESGYRCCFTQDPRL